MPKKKINPYLSLSRAINQDMEEALRIIYTWAAIEQKWKSTRGQLLKTLKVIANEAAETLGRPDLILK